MSSFARTCILAAVLSLCAHACDREPQGVTLTWMPPTEFEDGSALPPESVSEYRIYVGEDRVASVAPDQTEYFLELPPGEWDVTISAVAYGVESPHGEPAHVTIR